MARAPAVSAKARAAFQPRDFRLYNIGAPKTGTLSITNLFKPTYRSVHEGRYVEAIDRLIERRNGTISDGELIHWLRQRDTLLWAECESSHILCWFADLIKVVFKDAKFIVTVRDCYSWTNSVIDQHINNDPGPLSKRLRDVYYGDKSTQEDHVLTKLNEYKLSGDLSYWSSHYEYIIENLSLDDIMFVPTKDISSKTKEIAGFTGVPESTLNTDRAHSHAAPRKHDVLREIGIDEVRTALLSRCEPVASRLSQMPGLEGLDFLRLPSS